MTVSIIIPTYNRAHLLAESIDSVLRQTYQDFEVFVVDDGSIDQTAEIVRSYGDRVRFIQQEHMGPNAARNRALAESKGRYIALLDDDDLWFDFKLELQVVIMDRFTELGFLFSDFCILKDSGEKIHAGLRTWHKTSKPWDEIFDRRIKSSSLNSPFFSGANDFDLFIGNLYYELLFAPYVNPCSAIIRRSFIDGEIKFIDKDFHCGDWDFFARLSKLHPVGFMDCETTINRSHGDSVRLTRKSIRVQTECRISLINRVWKSDKDFVEGYGEEIARVEGEQILKLAKYCLLENDIEKAQQSLLEWKRLGLRDHYSMVLLLTIMAKLPYGHRVLMGLLNLKRIVFSKRVASKR